MCQTKLIFLTATNIRETIGLSVPIVLIKKNILEWINQMSHQILNKWPRTLLVTLLIIVVTIVYFR